MKIEHEQDVKELVLGYLTFYGVAMWSELAAYITIRGLAPNDTELETVLVKMVRDNTILKDGSWYRANPEAQLVATEKPPVVGKKSDWSGDISRIIMTLLGKARQKPVAVFFEVKRKIPRADNNDIRYVLWKLMEQEVVELDSDRWLQIKQMAGHSSEG